MDFASEDEGEEGDREDNDGDNSDQGSEEEEDLASNDNTRDSRYAYFLVHIPLPL